LGTLMVWAFAAIAKKIKKAGKKSTNIFFILNFKKWFRKKATKPVLRGFLFKECIFVYFFFLPIL